MLGQYVEGFDIVVIDDGFQEGRVKALEQFEWTFADEPLVLYRPDVASQHTRLADERLNLLEAWRPDETDAVRRREREAALEEDARTPRALDTMAAGARASGERALRRVLTDVSLRHRLAGAGHALFKIRFTADALTTGLGDVYEGLGLTLPEREGG